MIERISVFLLGTVFSILVHAQQAPVPYIIGGDDAGFDEYDFVAYLLILDTETDQAFFCTGSFIHPQYVVTAAHCLMDDRVTITADEVTVRYGNQELGVLRNRRFASVSDFDVHPDFDPLLLTNDIAILKLSAAAETEVVEGDAGIVPAEVITREQVAQVESGALVSVAGWGRVEEDSDQTADTLQVATMSLLPGNSCERVYFSGSYNSKTNLCAGTVETDGPAICNGDSGGPMFIEQEGDYYFMGITSAGPVECGDRNLPGIYTSVCVYLPFLSEFMGPQLQYIDQQCPVYPEQQTPGEYASSPPLFNENDAIGGNEGTGSWSLFGLLALVMLLISLRFVERRQDRV
ncbi:MAG: serine protease [Pseudomonadota bacterium]|nr:serine protease [Pseudomonadota bacterium]